MLKSSEHTWAQTCQIIIEGSSTPTLPSPSWLCGSDGWALFLIAKWVCQTTLTPQTWPRSPVQPDRTKHDTLVHNKHSQSRTISLVFETFKMRWLISRFAPLNKRVYTDIDEALSSRLRIDAWSEILKSRFPRWMFVHSFVYGVNRTGELSPPCGAPGLHLSLPLSDHSVTWPKLHSNYLTKKEWEDEKEE